jgi:hypothetical protein
LLASVENRSGDFSYEDIEKLNVAIKDKPANVNQPVYFKVIQKIFGYSERYLNY